MGGLGGMLRTYKVEFVLWYVCCSHCPLCVWACSRMLFPGALEGVGVVCLHATS